MVPQTRQGVTNQAVVGVDVGRHRKVIQSALYKAFQRQGHFLGTGIVHPFQGCLKVAQQRDTALTFGPQEILVDLAHSPVNERFCLGIQTLALHDFLAESCDKLGFVGQGVTFGKVQFQVKGVDGVHSNVENLPAQLQR